MSAASPGLASTSIDSSGLAAAVKRRAEELGFVAAARTP